MKEAFSRGVDVRKFFDNNGILPCHPLTCVSNSQSLALSGFLIRAPYIGVILAEKHESDLSFDRDISESHKTKNFCYSNENLVLKISDSIEREFFRKKFFSIFSENDPYGGNFTRGIRFLHSRSSKTLP